MTNTEANAIFEQFDRDLNAFSGTITEETFKGLGQDILDYAQLSALNMITATLMASIPEIVQRGAEFRNNDDFEVKTVLLMYFYISEVKALNERRKLLDVKVTDMVLEQEDLHEENSEN